jgi:hypothetical protein
MIYFGQEYGVRGMDKEGFSGCDGRTTIFDYWSVDTMVRPSKKQYTLREKHLYDTYVKVMNIAQQEKAVKQGVMFDLMYVNGHLQQQFAFIRKYAKEMLLVVANFSEMTTTVNVQLPAHAFDYLKVKEQTVTATDLLTEQQQTLALQRDKNVAVEVDGLGAKMLRIRL